MFLNTNMISEKLSIPEKSNISTGHPAANMHARPKKKFAGGGRLRLEEKGKQKTIDESLYFNPGGAVCFYDGVWHDKKGNIVNVSRREERNMTLDMAHMEAVNYRSMPGYVMLGEYDGISDIIENYLGADVEDGFVYFSGTDPNAKSQMAGSNVSPVTNEKEYFDSLYLLAELNTVEDLMNIYSPGVGNLKIAELADMCGRITRKTIDVLDQFTGWCRSHGAIGIYCDARQDTSQRLIDSPNGRRLLEKYGYSDMIPDKGPRFMTPHLFVDMRWYSRQTSETKRAIQLTLGRYGGDEYEEVGESTEMPPSADILYIAVKLDQESKNTLEELIQNMFDGGYGRTYCDYMTLAYGPDQVEAYDMDLIGKSVELEAYDIIYDGKAAALFIGNQAEYFGVCNIYPHITLAVANGVKPVYSNDMIRRYMEGTGDAQMIQLENPVRLAGTVTAVPRRLIPELRIEAGSR